VFRLLLRHVRVKQDIASFIIVDDEVEAFTGHQFTLLPPAGSTD
jgi:hypothetical protein